MTFAFAMADYRHVYLSPHLDDAALSCGGLIHRQTRAGERVLVVTIFAGRPDCSVLSPFARELHQRWDQPAGAVDTRRAEDIEAMRVLGADYLHWEYLDCIYRRHTTSGQFLYDSETAIFGAVHLAEAGLPVELARRLGAIVGDEVTVYSPLAVGHHVDHQLLLRAVLVWGWLGRSLMLYEDYPYAEDGDELATALGHLSDVPKTLEVRSLSEEDLAARVAAIARYASQIGTFWVDVPDMARRIRAYAASASSGTGYVERYWRAGKSSAPRVLYK